MTDWMRALSRGAGPDTPVTELMVRHPITLSIEDDGAVAATVVREHRVKNLPVVKCRGTRQLVGCLRTRRLMAHVFNRVGPSKHERANRGDCMIPRLGQSFAPRAGAVCEGCSNAA